MGNRTRLTRLCSSEEEDVFPHGPVLELVRGLVGAVVGGHSRGLTVGPALGVPVRELADAGQLHKLEEIIPRHGGMLKR